MKSFIAFPHSYKEMYSRTFGPVVKNPPGNVGNVGLIPKEDSMPQGN